MLASLSNRRSRALVLIFNGNRIPMSAPASTEVHVCSRVYLKERQKKERERPSGSPAKLDIHRKCFRVESTF